MKTPGGEAGAVPGTKRGAVAAREGGGSCWEGVGDSWLAAGAAAAAARRLRCTPYM